ncbi:MAG: indole-3-glycerol phosphate synthase TrpC [Polyangia bacterium]
MTPSGLLGRILAVKHHEHALRDPVRLDELWADVAKLPPARPFAAAIHQPGTLRAIAEFKRSSPSAGVIRPGADPADIARRYERAGAAAISVLTDATFFDGSMADLRAVHLAVGVPVLRKDFLLDERDLLQARLAGADAVLLIVRILDAATLAALVGVARRAGLAALVEAHDDAEIAAALAAGAEIIGVNHRDLDTLAIDLSLSARARALAPHAILVGESGIQTAAHVAQMRACGVDAILVGESLLRAPDPGAALADLLA